MNKSKNVLQFVCYRSPYGGSFFKSLLRLEQTLKKENIEMVYLFHVDTSDIDWVQNLIQEGKKIYFLTGSFSKDVLVVKNILAKYQIKYLHAHFAGLKYYFMFKLAKMLYGGKLFIIRHLRNHDMPRGAVVETLRKLLNHVDLYIGCSESVGIEFQKNFNLKAEQVTYVTNAIDFERLDKYETLQRQDFQIAPSTTVFLLFGFDYHRKGVDVVLEAMNNLVAQNQDVCLLLSLSVNRPEIEAKIIERFGVIPSWLRILNPRDDIASYYKLSNYFISASREEGFCNALVEAAYCERPIISSDIPGPQSLNIPHTYMFPSADVPQLQNAMMKLISLTNDEKEQITTAQKAYVVKAFDLNMWATQILQKYKKLG